MAPFGGHTPLAFALPTGRAGSGCVLYIEYNNVVQDITFGFLGKSCVCDPPTQLQPPLLFFLALHIVQKMQQLS